MASSTTGCLSACFLPRGLSLFQPGVPVAVFRWVFLLACIASTLVIVGYQTRAAGTALHAILKLDIARAPEFWRLRHLGMLRLCNYWALIVEPLLALMFVLPFNSVAKWSVVVQRGRLSHRDHRNPQDPVRKPLDARGTSDSLEPRNHGARAPTTPPPWWRLSD